MDLQSYKEKSSKLEKELNDLLIKHNNVQNSSINFAEIKDYIIMFLILVSIVIASYFFAEYQRTKTLLYYFSIEHIK